MIRRTTLPLCSGFGSGDPKGGSRDEVALKVEGGCGPHHACWGSAGRIEL